MKEYTIQLVVPVTRRVNVFIEAESWEEALEKAEELSKLEETYYREDENDSYDFDNVEINDIDVVEISVEINDINDSDDE